MPSTSQDQVSFAIADNFLRSYGDENLKFTQTQMVTHNGVLVAFALSKDRRFWYSVLEAQGTGADQDPRDSRRWFNNPKQLSFANEIRRVGYGDFNPPPLDVVRKDGILDAFASSTARFTALAPFQVISDGAHIFLFRQSQEKPADFSGSPLVDGTLLVDRFVLAGSVIQPKLEVRYKRSRKKSVPASATDTLSHVDMANRPFVEPTHELAMLGKISGGQFAVLQLPTQVADAKRWQFFLFNGGPKSNRIDSFNIACSDDGLFDTQGPRFYTSPDPQHKRDVLQRMPGTDPFTKRPLVPMATRKGFAETALDFNGSTSFASIPDATHLGLKTAYTVEIWMKVDDISPPQEEGDRWQAVFSKGSYDQANPAQSKRAHSIWLTDGGMLTQHFTHGGNWNNWVRTPKHTIKNKTWHHVAITASLTDGKARIFVDGREAAAPLFIDAAKGGEFVTNNSPILIGCGVGHILNNYHFFKGQLDEIRLWKEARSEVSIRGSMSHRLVGNEPGLVGYWRLDEGSGHHLQDQSDNQHHGQVLRSSPLPTVTGTNASAAALEASVQNPVGYLDDTPARWVQSEAPIGDNLGITRSSFALKKSETGLIPIGGLSTALFFEHEPAQGGTDEDRKKPTRQNARVMLAVPVKSADDPAQTEMGIIDFAVSREGKLAQVPEMVTLSSLKQAEESKSLEQLLKKQFKLESSIASIKRSALENSLNYACQISPVEHGKFKSPPGTYRFERTDKPDEFKIGNGNHYLTIGYSSFLISNKISHVMAWPNHEAGRFKVEKQKGSEEKWTISLYGKKLVSYRFEVGNHNHRQSMEVLCLDAGTSDTVLDVALFDRLPKHFRDWGFGNVRVARNDSWRLHRTGAFLGHYEIDIQALENELQQARRDYAEKLSTSYPMKHLHIDTFGLTTRAGLLEFVKSEQPPDLFANSDGNLAMYFKAEPVQGDATTSDSTPASSTGSSEAGPFQVVYYDTKAPLHAVQLNTERSADTSLFMRSRWTGSGAEKTTISIKDYVVTKQEKMLTADDARIEEYCNVTVANTDLGIIETWKRVPRAADKFAQVLNGLGDEFTHIGVVAPATDALGKKYVALQAAATIPLGDKPILRIGDDVSRVVGHLDAQLGRGRIKFLTLKVPLNAKIAPGTVLRVGDAIATIAKAEKASKRIDLAQITLANPIEQGTEIRVDLAPIVARQLTVPNRSLRTTISLERAPDGRMQLAGPNGLKAALSKDWLNWVHLAFVQSGKNWKVFADGQEVFSVDHAEVPVFNIERILIGTEVSQTTDTFFKGKIDRATVWSKARSYSPGGSNHLRTFRVDDPTTEPDLVGLWAYDEGLLRNGLWRDHTSHARHARISGQVAIDQNVLDFQPGLQSSLDIGFRPGLVMTDHTVEIWVQPNDPGTSKMTLLDWEQSGARVAKLDQAVEVPHGTPVYAALYSYSDYAKGVPRKGSRLVHLALAKGSGKVTNRTISKSADAAKSPQSSWRAFNRGQALVVGDKALASAPALSFSGSYTLEAWLQPYSLSAASVPVYNAGGGSSLPNFLLSVKNDGKLVFATEDQAYETTDQVIHVVSSGTGSSDAQDKPTNWHHVAVSFTPAFGVEFKPKSSDIRAFIDAGGEVAYNLTEELTIEMSLQTGRLDTSKQGLLSKGILSHAVGGDAGVPFALWIEDNALHFAFEDNQGREIQQISGGVLAANTKYEIAVVRRKEHQDSSSLTFDDDRFEKHFKGAGSEAKKGDARLKEIKTDEMDDDDRKTVDDFSRARTVEGVRRERKHGGQFGTLQSFGLPGFDSRFRTEIYLRKAGDQTNDTGLVASESTDAASVGQNAFPLIIGAVQSGATSKDCFQGKVSQVRLWTTPRAPNMLWQDQDRSREGPSAWWLFEEGQGLETKDSVTEIKARLEGGTSWCRSPFEAENRCQIYVNGYPRNYKAVDVPNDLSGSDGKLWKHPQFSLGGVLEGTAFKNPFFGRIDEVRVWSTLRSQEQILDNLYARPKEDKSAFHAYYQFDPSVEEDKDGEDRVLIKPRSLNGPVLELKQSSPTSATAALMNKFFALSTAPISEDSALTQGALGDIFNAQFHQKILSKPSVREYGELQNDANGMMFGVLKRAYSYIDAENKWKIVSGYKVGNLTSEWVGQVQFNPQVKGFVEGAPPVPSENMTAGVKNPKTGSFTGASSVKFQQAREVNYALSDSQSGGFSTAFNLEYSRRLKMKIDTVIAPIGVGVTIDGTFDIGGKFGLDLNGSDTWSSGSNFGIRTNTSKELDISLGGDWEEDNPDSFLNKALPRRFQPSNVGFALVESDTADVYALRLDHNDALVAYHFLPNADIKRDVNIVPFPINPRYTKQGTLDGRVGYDERGRVVNDPDYPNAKQWGEFSYMKPTEAYQLKQDINRQTQQHESQFRQYMASEAPTGALASTLLNGIGGAFVGATAFSELTTGVAAAMKGAAFAGAGLVSTMTGLVRGVAGSESNLAHEFAPRSLVNTYVWTADGGVYSEETNVALSFQETTSSDYSFQGAINGAMTLGSGVSFGPQIGFEMGGTLGGHFNTNKTKTRSQDDSFNVSVMVDPPGDLQSFDYDADGKNLVRSYANGKPVPAPGKVDAYRFMTFLLTPSSDNFETLFNQVVDPIWLAQSNQPNAEAMRQAAATSRKPPCWRLMHRVTFVSRLLPEFPDSTVAPLAHAMRDLDIKSHWELISRVDPFLRHRASELLQSSGRVDDGFQDEVRRVIDQYIPQLNAKDSKVFLEVLRLLAGYYGLDIQPEVLT